MRVISSHSRSKVGAQQPVSSHREVTSKAIKNSRTIPLGLYLYIFHQQSPSVSRYSSAWRHSGVYFKKSKKKRSCVAEGEKISDQGSKSFENYAFQNHRKRSSKRSRATTSRSNVAVKAIVGLSLRLKRPRAPTAQVLFGNWPADVGPPFLIFVLPSCQISPGLNQPPLPAREIQVPNLIPSGEKSIDDLERATMYM